VSIEKNVAATQPVCARLTVFVGGFDPRGARHYHQLMRREADKQSLVADVPYEVGSRSRWAPGLTADLQHSIWTISAGQGADSDYLFLDWSDLVRRHWPQHTWQVVAQAWRTYMSVFKVRATLPPVHKETPYVLWTLAYPLVYMLLCLLMALAVLLVGPAVLAGWQGWLLGCLAAGFVLLGATSWTSCCMSAGYCGS